MGDRRRTSWGSRRRWVRFEEILGIEKTSWVRGRKEEGGGRRLGKGERLKERGKVEGKEKVEGKGKD